MQLLNDKNCQNSISTYKWRLLYCKIVALSIDKEPQLDFLYIVTTIKKTQLQIGAFWRPLGKKRELI